MFKYYFIIFSVLLAFLANKTQAAYPDNFTSSNFSLEKTSMKTFYPIGKVFDSGQLKVDNNTFSNEST